MRSGSGRPPRLAEWLITRTVPEQNRDAVLGDLDETFCGDGRAPPRNPRLWYWGQALLFTTAYSAERLRSRLGRNRTDDSERAAINLGEVFMVEVWLREMRVAFRALRKRPGFVVATVGTLALGIGANTAIFSVINGVMLRPLPFDQPEDLVDLSEWWKDSSNPGGSSMNPANFVDLQESVRTIEGMTPYTSWSANLSGGDRPQRIRGLMVGADFFSTLRVQPLMGRAFTVEDDTDGSPDVAILTYELWQDMFGGDPGMIGRDLVMNSTPYTVIGILPRGTDFPGVPRIFVPLQFHGQEHSRGGRYLDGIGRLASGATVEMAQQDMMAGYAPLETEYADQNDNWSAWAAPLHDLVARPSQRRSLTLLGWAVGLVLLIACLNVANLLLVRAETRQREIALRLALGAGKARLVPHFLAEGLLISSLGGLIGIGIAYGGLQGIKRTFSNMLPRPEEISLDSTTLLFALAVSVFAGLVVGLVPAIRMRSVDLQADLKEGSRGSSGGGSKLRQSLVVGEIAIAVVILAVAGLLGNSFYRVAKIDTGLQSPEKVLVAQLVLGDEYEDAAARARFFGELLAEVETMPGVSSAGVSSRLPLFGGNNFTNVPVVGDPERVSHFVEWRMVTPGFFDATGVVLEEGRMMDASDAAADTLQTIMINRELARQLFPDESPLGKRIDVFSDGEGLEIIGVVSDLRDLGHERAPPPGVYAAAGNSVASPGAYLLVRTATDPLQVIPQLRQAIRRLDPNLPLFGTRTLEDVVRRRLGGRMFSISLLGIFATVAVLLGAIGIYGVMSYAVTERTREMGIRLALGAETSDVIRLVIKHGVRLTIFGLALGLGGAWFSTRWISAQLFGVEATDPLTYLAVAVLLGGISLLASYLPARRASRTDPLEALRAE